MLFPWRKRKREADNASEPITTHEAGARSIEDAKEEASIWVPQAPR